MRPAPRSLLLVAFAMACASAACFDTAVVGVDSDCAPACGGDERCHPELHVCVECMDDGDCSTKHDDAPFCDARGFTCAQCRDSNDCGDGGEHCIGGACRTCVPGAPDCLEGPRCDHADPRCNDGNRGPGNSGDDPRSR
jgi:hypothetical protein